MNQFKHCYDPQTGRILVIFGGADLELQVGPEGSDCLMSDVAANVAGDYILDGAVTPRPELPVSQAGNTLTVPPGTEYEVRGPATAEGITEDGELEFEFSEPGTYTVTLRNFPYLDAEVTLEG